VTTLKGEVSCRDDEDVVSEGIRWFVGETGAGAHLCDSVYDVRSSKLSGESGFRISRRVILVCGIE
jgi:hypothetical protein